MITASGVKALRSISQENQEVTTAVSGAHEVGAPSNGLLHLKVWEGAGLETVAAGDTVWIDVSQHEIRAGDVYVIEGESSLSFWRAGEPRPPGELIGCVVGREGIVR